MSFKHKEIEGRWEEIISHQELSGCLVRVTVLADAENKQNEFQTLVAKLQESPDSERDSEALNFIEEESKRRRMEKPRDLNL